MAQRLSAFTNLDKYAITDIPQWRIHVFFDAPEEPVLFARDYHAALNYGDASGNAYLGVTVPLLDAASVLDEDVNVECTPRFRRSTRHDQCRRRHRHLGDQRRRTRALQRAARASGDRPGWKPT